MVMPSGRWNTCQQCGGVFPEGDVYGLIYCCDDCEAKAARLHEERRRQLELELARTAYRKTPSWQI